MPYFGSQPTASLATTADLGDDIVTLAKLAGGTDGNVISFDASGNPVAIATGNDGQVLTSTGAGSPPAFEAAASSALVFIGSETAGGGSGTATLDVTIASPSTYEAYLIILSDCLPITDGGIAQLRCGDSSGIDSASDDYDWWTANIGDNAFAKVGDASDSQMDLNRSDGGEDLIGNGAGEGFTGTVWCTSGALAETRPSFTWSGLSWQSGTQPDSHHGGGGRSAVISMDRFQFLFASGNVESGTMRVYGYAKS